MGNYMLMSFLLAFLSMNIVIVYGQFTPRSYDIYINNTKITKLCNSTVTLTANGSVPGPIIYANKGETIHVNVYNNGSHGITIHWHGILQPRNPWHDGPQNITQCPIEPGKNFTYELIFSREEGTIWYHAHSEWSMATVHGAIIVKPEYGYPYPILPDGEQQIILGSWYIEEVMVMYNAARANNNTFPPANATTINGEPGYPNSCSANSSFEMTVDYNKTYLLRVVNAVLNEDQFFGIAGHNLTLVGHDGAYTKPLTSDYIRIAPGQTMDVLFTANQTQGCYFMAAAPYFPGVNPPPSFTNTTTSAILKYRGSCGTIMDPNDVPYPKLPAMSNTTAAAAFTNAIRSLNSREHPAVVPKNITKNVSIVASVGNTDGVTYAALNNITFNFPSVSILQAYVQNLSGYFEEDFPSQIADIPAAVEHGTKALMFNYGDEVEIVFSGGVHPMHIHGFTFYVVANGTGDFPSTIADCSETTDPDTPCYNLVDPPELNTVSIPDAGWVAIRFVADNPGVWFVHCHYERHLSLGMSTVFIVRNGTAVNETMLPTPNYMPRCTCKTGETCLSSAPIEEEGVFWPFASI